jgi:NAD(P)-dependent dehydrogenase (short-subunit alcohol dehydrogenase family)
LAGKPSFDDADTTKYAGGSVHRTTGAASSANNPLTFGRKDAANRDGTLHSMNVVVGAGSGMGEAVSRALADRGQLLLADKDGDAVSALAGRLGAEAEALACDITRIEDVAALAKRVDHLDAVVVTAGLSPAMPGRPVYEVNLVGMARVLDALYEAVGPGTAGVCIASAPSAYMAKASPEILAIIDDPLAPDFLDRLAGAGVDVDDGLAAYNFTKRGVVRLARRLAPVWGSRGGRIVSVSPGITDTPMVDHMLSLPGWRSGMEDRISQSPYRRKGRAEEIASVVAFLCSPAASLVNGTDLVVDGGAFAGDSSRGQFPEWVT